MRDLVCHLSCNLLTKNFLLIHDRIGVILEEVSHLVSNDGAIRLVTWFQSQPVSAGIRRHNFSMMVTHSLPSTMALINCYDAMCTALESIIQCCGMKVQRCLRRLDVVCKPIIKVRLSRWPTLREPPLTPTLMMTMEFPGQVTLDDSSTLARS